MLKVRYIFVIGLCLFFGFVAFANDDKQINENNWLNHPKIIEIRSIYHEVEALISEKKLEKK